MTVGFTYLSWKKISLGIYKIKYKIHNFYISKKIPCVTAQTSFLVLTGCCQIDRESEGLRFNVIIREDAKVCWCKGSTFYSYIFKTLRRGPTSDWTLVSQRIWTPRGYGLPGPYSLADLDRGVHFQSVQICWDTGLPTDTSGRWDHDTTAVG